MGEALLKVVDHWFDLGVDGRRHELAEKVEVLRHAGELQLDHRPVGFCHAQDDQRAVEEGLGHRLAGVPRQIDADLFHRGHGMVGGPVATAGRDAGGDYGQRSKWFILAAEKMLDQAGRHGAAADVRRADDQDVAGAGHAGKG